MTTRCWWCLAVIAALAAIAVDLRSSANVDVVAVAVRPFRETIPEFVPDQVVATTSGYYALDSRGHRILEMDGAKLVVRQIGRIGQDPGSLYHPAWIAVHADGHLYVLDDVAHRIQTFGTDGHLDAHFSIDLNINASAVASDGHVLVNDPQTGYLVTELDRSGKLVRRFGALHHMSDFYGPAVRSLDKTQRYSANRGIIGVDRTGNVYVAFENAPFIEKYDSAGTLVFSKPVDGVEADMIRDGVQRTKDAPMRHSVRGDESAGPYVVNGFAMDGETGTMYLVLQWKQSWIYVLDSAGTTRGVLTGQLGPMSLRNVTLDARRHTLLASRNAVRPSERAYEIVLPERWR